MIFSTTLIIYLIQIVNSELINYSNLLEILTPTTNSSNLRCKIQTQFYLEELKKSKLWASEMFDASSKFPSGILYGSTTDFGNFDECVGISVPFGDTKLSGRYCMAKIDIKPFENIGNKDKISDFYLFGENEFSNVWETIAISSHDRSKMNRNEIYFSFCIPSSCTHSDLEESVNKIIEKNQIYIENFNVAVTVNENNCYVNESVTFTTADQIFLLIIAVIVVLISIATLYDLLIDKQYLETYTFKGQKNQVLISFSLVENFKKLSTESQDVDGLKCINGLKVISMFLIIMGHRIMHSGGAPLLNAVFIENKYTRIETMILLNGPIIVDTFFTISGFIACYLLLKEIDKRKKINYLIVCLHRLLRLTPSYVVVIAFYCTIFVKIGSGPLWLERVGAEQERCLNSWWANLLYLNNFINKDNICMFQSWFITCDMHYFLICLVIVAILHKKPRLGLGILLSLITLSVITVFITIYVYDEYPILLTYIKFLRDPVVNSTYKNIYIPSHMRASPYFVGIFAGYLKYQIRINNYKLTKIMVYLGWPIAFALNLITIFSAFVFYKPNNDYDNLSSALYGSIHHFTWSLGISWGIIAVSEGNGPWLKALFCWKPLTFLSRITYTAFLCHGAIQLYTVAILRSPTYASIFTLIWYITADIALAYIIGFVLCIVFESPVIQLEKLIFQKDLKPRLNEIKEIPSDVLPKIKVVN